MKLNENQVRAIVKKTSDALEKLSIASLAVGIFQGQNLGIWLGVAFMGVSYALTIRLEK
jgi:hypothetical protein